MSRDDLAAAAAAEVDRWEQAFVDELLRLFDRQEAVVLARLQGTKARKHTRHWEPAGERKLDPKYIVDPGRWLLEAAAVAAPLLTRLFVAVYSRLAKRIRDTYPEDATPAEAGQGDPETDGRAAVAVEERVEMVRRGVETARVEVEEFIARQEDAGGTMAEIAEAVREFYRTRKPTWAQRIAVLSVVGSINSSSLMAATDAGSSAKQWVSRRDSRVRATHVHADRQVRLLDEPFRLGGIPAHPRRSRLMFPGDASPGVPLDEVINCRCTLLFSPPKKRTAGSSVSQKSHPGAETKVGREGDGIAALPGEDSRAEQAECSCCGGTGEHPDGHECYVCDASGTAAAQAESGPPGFCEGHHGVPDEGPENARVRYGDDFHHKGVRVVRTPEGAAHYGQPIGTPIRVDLAPTFSSARSSASSSSSSASRPTRPPAPKARRTAKLKVDGRPVDYAASDPQVVAMVRQHQPGLQLPDGDFELLAVRDGRGRVGAYVAWQTRDGADGPRGKVLAVSVHPALQGRRIGDQLVAAAVAEDAAVSPSRPARSSSTSTRSSSSSTRAAQPARQASRAAASATGAAAGGPPQIPDLSKPTDAPGTSGDFARDAERIERLQKAYARFSTTALYSRGGRFSRDREKQQQAIIDHFLNAPGVKADRKALVLGGLPGAGKTTTITSAAGQSALGIDLSEYVTVNADEVKAEMIRRGMVPTYPGLTADESATLFHAESFEVAHALMRQATRRGLNLVYDTSLKSTAQLGFVTSAASRSAPPRYEVTAVLVDVPVKVAKDRAKARYLSGDRYMPLALIDSMKAYGGGRGRSSLPAQNFDQIKRTVDRWFAFDNAGAAPALTGQGGKRSGTNRP